MTPATRAVELVPLGTSVSRYLMAKALSNGQIHQAVEIARQWRDTPQVAACFEAQLETKAAVAPGTTYDPAYASPLVQYGIAGDVLTLLRGVSIFSQLEAKMRRVPFHVRMARELTAGVGAAWIAEGAPTPVVSGAYDNIYQEAYKTGAIKVLTKELLRAGDPIAEAEIRASLVQAVATFIDQQFLLPTVALIPRVQPAAITNGATAAAINTDLTAMRTAITTPGARVWIMRPGTADHIAAMIGGTAQVNVPTSLFGTPLIVSPTSPAQITLIDPSQILFSAADGVEVDASDEITLQMDSAPTDPPVAATVTRSLWQENEFAVKAMRYLAYLRGRDGSVAYMTVAY